MRSLLTKLIIAVILATGTAAMGFEPMAATIKISSGSLYDYVFIGENRRATDGYDNAFDTISPGNLNADLGEPFLSVVMLHGDWKAGTRELRGDVRSLAKHQKWHLCVSSSLPAGTPLKVELAERGALPKGITLTLWDAERKIDLGRSGECLISAPGPGKQAEIIITAEQQ